jgi:phosphoribosylglycinamide formyltransferase-1
MSNTNTCPIVVLLSGNGSNLQAIIDAQQAGLNIAIRAVISDNPQAYGLERAQAAHIPSQVINPRTASSPQAHDAALVQSIASYQPQLVVLAGYMRILSAKVVNHFPQRILNIHPSLLPKYRGLHTHQRALENGEQYHGCSVHIVTTELDAGPILAQASLRISPEDTATSLKQRVQTLEHRLYPQVIARYCQN